MTTPAAPLDEVARRIAQQQAELEALREEYEVRKAQLAELARRKEELNAQLAQVDAEIQAVKQGSTAQVVRAATKLPVPRKAAGVSPAKQPTPKKPAGVSLAAPTTPLPLYQMLVTLVREAGRPMTVKQLVDELVRQKFPTKSKNLADMVHTRVGELLRKGLLRRAKDQPGVLPGAKVAAAKPTPKAAAKPTQKAPPAKKVGREQPSLREVLTTVLQKNKQPLSGAELAKQARAAGYHSKSKDFANVVWVSLGKMDNVENVAGKGYRLKKR